MNYADPAEIRRRLQATLPPIAVAQTVAADGDIEANIAHHLVLAESAASAVPSSYFSGTLAHGLPDP